MAVMVQLTRTEQLLRPEPSRVPQQTRMARLRQLLGLCQPLVPTRMEQLPLRHLLEQCQPLVPTRMEQLPPGQLPQLPTPTLQHRHRLLQHQQPRRQPSTRQIGYGHSRLAGCFNILPASFVCQLQ